MAKAPQNTGLETFIAHWQMLSKERAAEDSRGLVRWLRPEYQIAKFGAPKEKVEKKVEAVLSSLARMGVIATAKSGRAFSLHRMN